MGVGWYFFFFGSGIVNENLAYLPVTVALP